MAQLQRLLRNPQLTSPHSTTPNGAIQFNNSQAQQLLTNSLTSTRIGNSLASAVLLRSMTQANQAAVATSAPNDPSRLLPYFMTHPGSTSGPIPDFSSNPAGTLNGLLNPYSLM